MNCRPAIMLAARLVLLMAALLLLAMLHASAASGEETDLRLYWDKGLKLRSEDKAFRMSIGGRIQADWAAMAANSDLDEALDAGDGGAGDPLTGFGVEFRRARLSVQGDIYEDVYFKAQLDFAPAFDGEEVQPRDLYAGYHSALGDLTFGQHFVPFSLEATTSSNYITFMERSIGVDALAPSRRIGASLFNGADGRLTWQAGAFSTSEGGNEYDNEDNWFAAGRVTALPWLEDDGGRLLHLGLAYARQFASGGNDIRYRARPEAHLAPSRLVDTGDLDAFGSDLLGAEAALVLGPVSLQGEYVADWVRREDGAGGDLFFQGYYAFVSWFVTGEHREYKDGVFSRVSPNENFSLADGGPGAWELALRWSDLDLNSKDVEGGRLQDVTAGVNWHLNPNTRVMLNYVHAMVRDRDSEDVVIDGRESADIVQMRFQVDW